MLGCKITVVIYYKLISITMCMRSNQLALFSLLQESKHKGNQSNAINFFRKP